MKTLWLSTALLAGFTGLLPSNTFAHGGTYKGPGDTVPPGGGGSGGGGGAGPGGGPSGPTGPGAGRPTTSAPGVPTSTNGAPGGGASSGGGGSTVDLSNWYLWWEYNQAPFLCIKSHVQGDVPRTGEESFFLGKGDKTLSKNSLKPTEEQIRESIVPALLAALEKEKDNDIVTGAMIALAKIGDAATETGDSPFEKVIARFLPDGNQEISETAAVALGILANTRSIPTLASLLVDSAEGRKLVAQPEVNYRTRAFAAYGLGLIGARTASEENRREIVRILRQTLETEDTKTRDLKVSCLIAMGLVPLATIDSGSAAAEEGSLVPPESSRTAQLDYVLAYLQDQKNQHYIRAHCPGVLARLLPGLPDAQHEAYRERIATDLIERLEPRKNEQAAVVQSAVLALGLIGTNDGASPLDRKIREAVASVAKGSGDQQARHFSLIALAKLGGTVAPGSKDPEGGIEEVSKALLAQLGSKGTLRPWAGLACGVMANKLGEYQTPRIAELQEAVRTSLKDAGDPERLGALAIAAGIMGDVEATGELMDRLDQEKDASTRGYVALGLGLMNARGACEKIQKVVDESKFNPELLKQAAIALGLLGDKQIVARLTDMLKNSKSLATQASISTALGFIGDRNSIDPLVAMLQNAELTGRARGFAAVALGIVADKEPLPWNSKIGVDLNYRASTQTLTDPVMGTGILDIL